ncbi:unnamed protein product [Durusdinium trenchii]|uniref:Uncharacterized protein n=2 Tax=Durusdinium trenchii TaxID=1381693 RepID=A0ABP0P2R7_9DINO
MFAMRAVLRGVLLCFVAQLLAISIESFTGSRTPRSGLNLRPTSVDVRLHATLSDALGGAKLPKYIEISQEALLAAAIVQGKKEEVKPLLETGAPLEAITIQGRTALACAAVINDPESARLLLESGAQLEALDDTGRTPLSLAAAYGHLEVVQLCIDSGACLEARDNGQLTPLLWAAVNGNEDVVRCLVANGADTQAKDEDGMRPSPHVVPLDNVLAFVIPALR